MGKRLAIIGIGILVMVVSVIAYRTTHQPASVPQQTPSQAAISINDRRIPVEIMDTPEKQAQGLSGRSSLAPDAGMLFVFSSQAVRHFWMKDMHFPLDMIWIANNTITAISANVPAPSSPTETLPLYTNGQPVDMVLEVNAGFASQSGIKVGDRVRIVTNGQ